MDVPLLFTQSEVNLLFLPLLNFYCELNDDEMHQDKMSLVLKITALELCVCKTCIAVTCSLKRTALTSLGRVFSYQPPAPPHLMLSLMHELWRTKQSQKYSQITKSHSHSVFLVPPDGLEHYLKAKNGDEGSLC